MRLLYKQFVVYNINCNVKFKLRVKVKASNLISQLGDLPLECGVLRHGVPELILHNLQLRLKHGKYSDSSCIPKQGLRESVFQVFNF